MSHLPKPARPPECPAVNELIEALRLTVEYVGTDTLPPIEGWSWYDAMVKHAPEVAARMKADYLPPTHITRVDKYTIEVNGTRVRAGEDTEARIRTMDRSQIAGFLNILGGGTNAGCC